MKDRTKAAVELNGTHQDIFKWRVAGKYVLLVYLYLAIIYSTRC